MSLRLAPLVAASAVLACLPALAGASIILTDGQVIKGTELSRDGDSYVMTMEGGNKSTFPAALVKEIRLEDDAPKPSPPFDFTKPKTLAGPAKLPSQDPKDQLKVLGPPTRWSKSALDTTWEPKDAYDPSKDVLAGSRSTWAKNAVDTMWTPTDAYASSKDVWARSHSTWTKDVVDTTWTPTDGWGFRPLTWKSETAKAVYPMDFAATAPAEASAPSGPTPWSCGESIFATEPGAPADRAGNRASSIRIRPVSGARYKALGVPLYQADAKVDGATRKAIFTIAGGECRLVGGDADEILGLNLTPEHTLAQDAAAFSAALGARGGAPIPIGVDKIDYALSFVSLTDPAVSGSQGAALTLISTPEQLAAIEDETPSACALGKARRRKEARAATAAFAPPRIVPGQDSEIATFLTWSSSGGTVTRNEVVIARSGVVTAKRQAVAAHVGSHTD
jgi:hypothetical protein